MYQSAPSNVILVMMRFLFVIVLVSFVSNVRAQVHYYEVSADYRDEMWDKSLGVVSARVVTRGRCVRMEVTYCTIRCVINESYKGKLKVGDTISIEVVEYGNINLGGKFGSGDEPIFSEGKSFVFFLELGYFGKFRHGGLYQPVDDVKGVFYTSPGLYDWIRNEQKSH